VLVAVVACKRVERLPSQQPIDQPIGWGQQDPAAKPAPAQRPVEPAIEVPAPAGCPIDKAAALVREVEIPDCGADAAWCTSECTRGSAAACFGYAALIQDSQKQQATNLFARACELGLAIACTNYAAGLWTDGANDADTACARRTFDKACQVKEPFACGMLGKMAIAGATDDAGRAAARAQLQKTCDQLGGPPCKMLADYLKLGKLGKFDPVEVQVLLKRACDGGDALACEDLQKAGAGSN
jgi:TPR repeat protein